MSTSPGSRRPWHLVIGLCAALLAGAGAARPPAKPADGKRTAPSTAGKPAASSKAPSVSATQRQQTLQREQRELQSELTKLKRQLAASQASHSEASDALASSDVAISNANRRLRELAATRLRIEQQIAALAQRERNVASRQSEGQRHLDELLRQQQRLALRDPWQLLLEGRNPGDLGRERRYLAYLSRDTESTVEQLQSRREELHALQQESEEKRQELAKIAEDEARNRMQMEREQVRRKRTLEQLSRQISGQRQSIARLERDEQRLGALIDQISKILAEQARKDTERARQQAEREAAAKRTARALAAPKSRGTTQSPPPNPTDLAATASNFAQQKGRLRLPVDGAVTARFGSSRRGEGGLAGPTWKGVFVRAPVGTEVKAVGQGQVVFADWLRGFGNLLVVDHGEGFLSVYGNNEALLRNVGDRIAVGEVIASVGNTGGNETPGLYFELRFQGRPFDPLTWVATR